MIYAHQQEYYNAINASNIAGKSTAFIEFMLATIKASLIDAINMSDGMSDAPVDKLTLRWQKIEAFLKTNDYIMNTDVQRICDVSPATANRILKDLVTNNKITKLPILEQAT